VLFMARCYTDRRERKPGEIAERNDAARIRGRETVVRAAVSVEGFRDLDPTIERAAPGIAPRLSAPARRR